MRPTGTAETNAAEPSCCTPVHYLVTADLPELGDAWTELLLHWYVSVRPVVCEINASER